MYEGIKSIEIFPEWSWGDLPSSILDRVSNYLDPYKATITVKAEHREMAEIVALCEQNNVRCQKYLI